MRIFFDFDSDRADDAAVLRALLGLHGAPGLEAQPEPAPPTTTSEEDLRQGALALGQLLAPWGTGAPFTGDHVVALVERSGELIRRYVQSHGDDLPSAIRGLQAGGLLATFPLHDVPTLLSMCSAVGVELPRSWAYQDYGLPPEGARAPQASA